MSGVNELLRHKQNPEIDEGIIFVSLKENAKQQEIILTINAGCILYFHAQTQIVFIYVELNEYLLENYKQLPKTYITVIMQGEREGVQLNVLEQPSDKTAEGC